MIAREVYLLSLLIIISIYNVYIHKKYVIPAMKSKGTYGVYKWYNRVGIVVVISLLVYFFYILFKSR